MFTFRQNIVCDPYIEVQAFMKIQQKALAGRSSASSTFYQVNPRNLHHPFPFKIFPILDTVLFKRILYRVLCRRFPILN